MLTITPSTIFMDPVTFCDPVSVPIEQLVSYKVRSWRIKVAHAIKLPNAITSAPIRETEGHSLLFAFLFNAPLRE